MKETVIGIFRLDKDGEPGRFIEVNNATTSFECVNKQAFQII